MKLRYSLRRRLQRLLDRLLPPEPISGHDLALRQWIIGTIALDTDWRLAESTALILCPDQPVGPCLQMVLRHRRAQGCTTRYRAPRLPILSPQASKNASSGCPGGIDAL